MVAVSLVITPASGASAHRGCARGKLLSSTELQVLTRDEVAAALRSVGLASGASFGVRQSGVVYCTVAPSGRPAIASGLLVEPLRAHGRQAVVVYAHGTETARFDAPSRLTSPESQLIPLVFAAEGFTVAAPDYLGLGVSQLTHPYVHAATEASASVDMLAAMGSKGGVFVTGFSQGGHSAMAIGQALSRSRGLMALAPIAGPYDMSGLALQGVLDPDRTDPAIGAVYLAYFLYSWKVLYGIYSDPHEVFAAPWASMVEGLFDGFHSVVEIAQALPDSPAELLLPSAVAWLSNPDGRLLSALRDNDVCHWAPKVPVRLYVGRLDRDVVPEHAPRCRDQIAAAGGSAEVVDMGQLDHVGTALASLPMIRDWFLSLH